MGTGCAAEPDPATEPMSDEFDALARWTARAVLALGPGHDVPAACRGSGGPAALDWLLDHLDPAPATTFLDVGAGVGGPAQYAARSRGVRPILLDPMAGACRAAARLFGLATAVGDGDTLPFPDGSVSVAWSLGVLCTVADKAAHLAEFHRVLGIDGRLGLLVYERTVDVLPEQPDGNLFPTAAEMTTLLAGAGFVVGDSTRLDDLPDLPAAWSLAADRVDDWIATRYSRTTAWKRADEQQRLLTTLLDEGLVIGRLTVAKPGS